MATVDSKDGSSSDAFAATVDSGSRPLADVAADTEMGDSSPVDASQEDSLLGQTLNERYRVTRRLGQGGMGAVYLAEHTLIGKQVAVKVLLDKHAEKQAIVARLKQEARLASSIGHDNIVDITDFGITAEGRTFVVMEYLDGESLGSLIARLGRLDEPRTIHICIQIASALAAAHDKGIVHRDIKPENIFLVPRNDGDFVKVVDFGISKTMDADDDDVRLTQTGMVLGTPLYMSPEQAAGEDDLDQRIDIYALGVILYESLTGEVPFQGKNYLNILTQVIADQPKAPSDIVPKLDRDLESVILKAMAKDRSQRYQSMQEILSDLQALSDPATATASGQITAARWRKRQERRSTRNYLTWGLLLFGVAATSVLAARALVEQEEVAPTDTPEAALKSDATMAHPARQSSDAAPALQTASIHLVSDPPGALVYRDARQVCGQPTPCDYTLVNSREQITLRVELPGYVSDILTVVPQLDNGATLQIQLKAQATVKRKHRKLKHSPKTRPQPKPKADAVKNDVGDVMGNPYHPKAE